MTLRHFEIFAAVCREEGMTRAAEALHISQPSISQAIRELEEHYGTPLFDRFDRRLYLTPAGKELLRYVRHILALTRESDAAMRGFAAGGPISVGATLSIGESIFIPLLVAYAAAHPQQRVFSRVANTAELEQRLLKDDIDLALIEGEIEAEALQKTPFLRDELVFLAPAARHLIGQQPREVIEGAPFFLREEGSGTRALFTAAMREAGISYEVRGVYNNSDSILKAVRAGLGFAALSRRVAGEMLADGSVTAFAVPGISLSRQFLLVWHQNKYLSPALQQFIEICQNFS